MSPSRLADSFRNNGVNSEISLRACLKSRSSRRKEAQIPWQTCCFRKKSEPPYVGCYGMNRVFGHAVRSPLTATRIAACAIRPPAWAARFAGAQAFRTILLSLMTVFACQSMYAAPSFATVLQPSRSPLITFRILFQTGSAQDPPGKEGVAALTAAMLAKGGSKELSYDQIVEAMYPLATDFDWQVDKEMTVFHGTTHRDNLDRYYQLISAMLLAPGFRTDDFTRLKTDAINFLKVNLRDSNDEELGKEELYNLIYAGLPYGHHNTGRVHALEALTLDDVRAFYRDHYTQASLVIGLAGSYSAAFQQKVEHDFTKLPSGQPGRTAYPPPKDWQGRRVEIIQRETRSTAISLGFPIDVKRGDKDWPALFLATSYFGQHRSSNSHLYERLREARGLNYGDYAYLEYFPRGMFLFQPEPNLARPQQIFQIWIRPVEPQNGLFALRAALYEYDQLLRDGLSQEAFESTREFLTKYVNILTQTQDARLGYALDSRYYGIGDFNQYLRDQLPGLTVEQVNHAIRRHLRKDQMQVVMVTKNAAGLRESLLQNRPSPITYNSPKPEAILAEDKIIANYKLELKPEAVTIVPVEQVFE
jgi:zinc protease